MIREGGLEHERRQIVGVLRGESTTVMLVNTTVFINPRRFRIPEGPGQRLCGLGDVGKFPRSDLTLLVQESGPASIPDREELGEEVRHGIIRRTARLLKGALPGLGRDLAR